MPGIVKNLCNSQHHESVSSFWEKFIFYYFTFKVLLNVLDRIQKLTKLLRYVDIVVVYSLHASGKEIQKKPLILENW